MQKLATCPLTPEVHDKIDLIEKAIVDNLTVFDAPIGHDFTDGKYIRSMVFPKDSIAVSHIHKTRHPFGVITGTIRIWDAVEGVKEITGPYFGWTEPNTRRVGYAVTDVVWSTCHITDKTTPEEVGMDILEPHDNPYLDIDMKSILGQLRKEVVI